ncbi:MAG: Chemotaxis protein methyltransferase CheR (EC [uncultured Sulfurovum sp.]|uniref:protein-glutamate O-methyltransferase n=1 Tax=uncultured Sulfurovum sp. TaxID=269237 RepID=A0A6S6SNM6_9BACT|nr:MAG: Chemotaxis protein methyltransferase CheR (EC [uncultured Sulfurovum sp.]
MENERFEIVGIGASAGGFEALQLFIKNLELKQDIAYIIAQHLDPKQPTMLVELLAKSTKIPITKVIDGEIPQKNHIYICPQNKNITLVDFRFRLTAPEVRIMPKPSVNIFFSSLAKDLENLAVGVILSGTGSDGAEGIKAIKNAGGITIAQEEKSAKYPSMPKSSIETGYVDAVLTPEQMAIEIPKIIKSPRILEEISDVPKNLDRIYDLLLMKVKIDFSDYKLSTIQRRIERRMSVTQTESLEEYVTVLEKSKKEIHLLHKDLLVIVTSFFRNKEAFEALEKVIANKLNTYSDTIRVWISGCATGEEAYTIAMLLHKLLKQKGIEKKIQIFATDISDEAIIKARAGTFIKEEIENIDNYYIKNYFVKKDEYYEISKQIRDMIIFSTHDIVKDPAFLKIDLISCRNLLIYFNNSLQKRIFSIFHHSLNSNGVLFLGKSESTSNLLHYFKNIDSKWKIFSKENTLSSPNITNMTYYPKRYPRNYLQKPMKEPINKNDKKSMIFDAINLSITKAFANDFLIVDRNNQIVFTNGEINKYIKIPVGNFNNDVFSFINDDIRIDLRAILSKAKRELVSSNQRVRTTLNGSSTLQYINILAFSLEENEVLDDAICIMFIESSDKIDTQNITVNKNSEHALYEMENELLLMKERLQTTNEELETTNEELQSTNEELQSSNEELQSTNEELQTSNEELQSSNEELTTVNDELEVRSLELRVSNTDLENTFNTLHFGVVILDKKLKIRKYTDDINKIFDIRISDIGETINSVQFYGKKENLKMLLLACLTEKKVYNFELICRNEIYNAVFEPYLNEQNNVDGLILSFYNISKLKENEQKLLKTTLELERHKHNLEEIVDIRTKKLEKSHSDIENLLNSVNNIIVVSKNGQELINANQKFYDFFKEYQSLDEFNERHDCICEFFEICDESDDFIYSEKVMKNNLNWVDFILSSKNKMFKAKIIKEEKTFIFDLKVTLMPDNDNLNYIIAMNDITLLHEYQTSLKLKVEAETKSRLEQEKFLIQQSKLASMGEMIGNIAHQWRQPLNSLSALNIGLSLKHQKGRIPFEEMTLFEKKSSIIIQRMSKTIDDFRNFFAPNKVSETFMLKEVIEEATQFIQPSYNINHIKLINHGSSNIKIKNHKNELIQVLLNLFNNAKDAIVEFNPNHGLVIINIIELEKHVQITVEDNGGGIKQEVIDRVFEPYFSTKFKDEGTGIGLYMSKMIIEESMQGELKLENCKEGVLATITLQNI